ncbi:MAG: hypothetical protein KF802_04650 [Bdellovibrionaceae bacterium]|nr:hypothetical protein [Pseudobdellovibrionaceae bacterium]MBX3033988.1 hypothetical protein [Pseudobdellovibrionaceae bacterium]
MSENYIASAAQIFTLFFVMLGPLKMLGPFAKASQSLSEAEIRKTAWRSTGLATLAAITGGFVGSFLLGKWGIPVTTLELTGGIIFLIAALLIIFRPPAAASSEPAPPAKPPTVAFSMIITTYGMAVVIMLLSLSQSPQRTLLVLGLLLLVMLLNLLSMMNIRRLTGPAGALAMGALGTALSVLQVALALQMILMAWQAGKPF